MYKCLCRVLLEPRLSIVNCVNFVLAEPLLLGYSSFGVGAPCAVCCVKCDGFGNHQWMLCVLTIVFALVTLGRLGVSGFEAGAGDWLWQGLPRMLLRYSNSNV